MKTFIYYFINVKDIKPVALTYVIEFMYCGVVEVPKKKLEDVLHAAKILEVKGLFNSSNHEGSNRSESSTDTKKTDFNSYPSSRNITIDEVNYSQKQVTGQHQNVNSVDSISANVSQEISCISQLRGALKYKHTKIQHLSDRVPSDRSKAIVTLMEHDPSDVVSTV